MTVPALPEMATPFRFPMISPAVEPLRPLVIAPPESNRMPVPRLPTLSTVPRLVRVQAVPLLPRIPLAPLAVELTSIVPVEVTVVGLVARV